MDDETPAKFGVDNVSTKYKVGEKMDLKEIAKLEELPERIKSKIVNVFKSTESIIEQTNNIQKTFLSEKISFDFLHSTPSDVLSPFEHAQSICFIAKYENLPIINGFKIINVEDNYYLDSIDYIRHIINEFRPIIKNHKDSIYYRKIHKFCRDKLMNRDPKTGLSITVKNASGKDVTEEFIKVLNERNSAISFIIERCEFDYIYDGILQHSDHNFTDKFLKDYHSGEINYIFLKHAVLLSEIKKLLQWHYTIINVLRFPKLGPL